VTFYNILHSLSVNGRHILLLTNKVVALLSTSNVSVCETVSVQDVFILDTQKSCYVWVGRGANPNESKNGFSYAHVMIAAFLL